MVGGGLYLLNRNENNYSLEPGRSITTSSPERSITIKGTSKQISEAKEMIEEKVREEESMRTNILSSRQPRVRHSPQPLFLNYSGEAEDDAGQPLSLAQP